MSLTRGFGNLLIRAAFRILIGAGTTDLLSGYRTFNRRFRRRFSFARGGSRSRPSLPARRLHAGFASSRSRFPITRGSPVRRASCGHFVMAGEFCR